MQALLLGHTISRTGKAGAFWWTVDGGPERFESLVEATDWIRSRPRWRPECQAERKSCCERRPQQSRPVVPFRPVGPSRPIVRSQPVGPSRPAAGAGAASGPVSVLVRA